VVQPILVPLSLHVSGIVLTCEEQQAIREIEEAEKLKKQSPAANQAEPAPKPVDGEPVKLDTAKQQ